MKHEITLARLLLVGLTLQWLTLVAHAAQFTSDNFIVDHPSPQFAREVAESAELSRARLAKYWLNKELPQWSKRCPITVKTGQMGAGGFTSFQVDRGEVWGWRMTVQGSPERIIDSVIPHEVNHTVFYSHFRRTIPRWYDEGAAMTLEHQSEQARFQQGLRDNWNLRYRVRELFAVQEYPQDGRRMAALYGQSASLSTYLLQIASPQTYVEFGEDGLSQGWERSLQAHYGVTVDELESNWMAWIRGGKSNTPTPSTSVTAAAIDPDKPDLIVFTLTDCPPCTALEDDVRSGSYAKWNVIFVKINVRTGELETPYQVIGDTIEPHPELDPQQLTADFKDATKVNRQLAYPILWARYTEHYYAGRDGGLFGWLRGMLGIVRDELRRLLIGRPEPIIAGQVKSGQVRSVDSNGNGGGESPFVGPGQPSGKARDLDAIRSEVDEAKRLAADAISRARSLQDEGPIGKARDLVAIKRDMKQLKEHRDSVSKSIKSRADELRDGIRNPLAWLGWLGWAYRYWRRRKGLVE